MFFRFFILSEIRRDGGRAGARSLIRVCVCVCVLEIVVGSSAAIAAVCNLYESLIVFPPARMIISDFQGNTLAASLFLTIHLIGDLECSLISLITVSHCLIFLFVFLFFTEILMNL